jgi:hypothetical protein
MMNKKIILYVIVMIISLSLVFAPDWGGGGSTYTPSSDSDDSGGGSGGGGSNAPSTDTTPETTVTLNDWCDYYHNCTALTVDAGIQCYYGPRTNMNQRRVVNAPVMYMGYINDDAYSLKKDEYSLNMLVESYGYDFIREAFLKSEEIEDVLWSYITYEWEDTYDTSIPWFTDAETDDVRLYRYEGEGLSSDSNYPLGKGCRAYGGSFFAVDVSSDGEGMVGIDQSGLTDYVFSPWSVPSDWESIWSDYGNDVVWDKHESDCTKIGGEWIGDENYKDEENNYYQCCGDDYIWVNNRPLTEDESGLEFDDLQEELDRISELSEEEQPAANWAAAANYCLYSYQEEDEVDASGIIGINLYDSTDDYDENYDYYTCDSTEFSDYDEALDISEEYSSECHDEEGNLLSSCPFLLITNGDEEKTDLGKWSDNTNANPLICRISSFEKGVPEFAWTNVNNAGDAVGDNGYPLDINGNEITDLTDPALRASTICEQYLGGKWTGSRCCGNKYDYDNSMYVDESYSETTPIYQNDGTTVKYRYACLQGEIYNTGSTAQYAKDDGTEVELLNSEGNWYACNADTTLIIDDFTNTQFISSDKNVAACTVVSSYLCNYNPDTSAWEWYSTNSGEEGSYVRNTLRYSSGEFTLSTAEWAEEGTQTQACCAGNTCWDGAQCVDEYTEHTYNVDDEEVVSVCHQGTWTGPLETKYDWYYNTDGAAVDYCVDSFSCICSSNEEDDTYCAPEGEYFTAGCTLEPNFYVNDHLCEQTTDSSRWTSRTKLLAFQLMQIAEGTEYVLFCDAYSNTLNNYVDVASIAEDINSFCVLKQDNTVTIGVTFNSGDAEQPMAVDADDILFRGSNAFVDIIDEDISDCDAIEATQTQIYGEYFSCDSSNNLFYNNVLNSLIYSKDGLTTVPYITNMNAYQTEFDAYKATMTNYIAANDITNLANNNLNDEFEAFNNIQDYNTIYYNTDGIFGFQEIKYTEDAGNRYFMGIVYTGMTPDCSQVYAPYETTELISCVDGIVLERSTSSSEYWTSLTAGLREE